MSQVDKKPKRKSSKEKDLNQELSAMRDELSKQEADIESSIQEEVNQTRVESDGLIEARLPQNFPPDNSSPSAGLGTKILSTDETSSEGELPDQTADESEIKPAVHPFVTADSTDLNSETLRTETIQPKYNENPTVPHSAFVLGSEETDFLKELEDRNKTLPLSDSGNEDFIKEITQSLEDDPYLSRNNQKTPTEVEEVEEIKGSGDGDRDYLAEIESEIEKAALATNPFEGNSIDPLENDFLSQLKDIFPEDYTDGAITKPLDDFEDLIDGEAKLSSESWQEVLNATEESSREPISADFLLHAPTEPDLENELFADSWAEQPDDVFSRNTLPEGEFKDPNEPERESQTELESQPEEENKESLENLRRSFIEEFEQTTWPEEEPLPEKEERWLQQKFVAFSKWTKSLNGAEKTLLIMSSFITLAVIVAIGLVLVKWQGNKIINGTPPEVIASVDPNLVYPTGLQLPGGWFFFLQRGELKNNKWDPQTAEWLVSSTVRRVIAIPWSRQAEAVVQTLNEGEELRVFMNNNDIMNYAVTDVKQVDREDVNILSANEPSLVVILFKSDNSDRWVIFAKPK